MLEFNKGRQKKMYYLKKTVTIDSAHALKLSYASKCCNLHGHSWKIIIYCKSETLDAEGMVIDFSEIKKQIETLDHSLLNDFIEQPTAENIAEYLCNRIKYCYKVQVEETEGNEVIYEK